MKNRIIPQMFDVRPVDEAGDLDWEKIKSVENSEQYSRQAVLNEKERIEKEREKQRILQLEKQNIFFEQQEKSRKEQEIRLQKEAKEKEWMLSEQRRETERMRQIIIDQEKKRLEQEREIIRLEQREKIRIEREHRENLIRQEKLQRELERAKILEEEKRLLEIQQQEVLEKISRIHREKEAAILQEKLRLQNEKQLFIQAEAAKRKEDLRKISEQNRRQQEEYESAVLAERKKREAEYSAWLQEELAEQKKIEERQSIFAAKISKSGKKKNEKEERKRDVVSGSDFSWQDLFSPPKLSFQFDAIKSLSAFIFIAIVVFFGVGGGAFASRGFGLKDRVLSVSSDGMENLNSAVGDISNQNFEDSNKKFEKAYESFSKGSQELNAMGSVLIDATRYIPYASKLSSGKNALEAGKHFSQAGKALNEVMKASAVLKNPINVSSSKEVSLLETLQIAQKNIDEAKRELDSAQENIDRINVDDLPADKQEKFVMVKNQLPDLRKAMDFFLGNNHIMVDLLGGNGPRKYLFLFQNNSEMRATGGFIGSYGLMDISNGHVKNFFIDGIFNPDGQLREKIVPPFPIQKISANWSMHDSNWFANFPTSAKKAIQFYEKTGGPTADGVITLTPTVMQKLLKITGPIEMPEYNVTLDSENFIEITQYKVEVDYDKEENKPKKILGDLAPLVLDKLLSSRDLNTISKTADVLLDALKEKHILFYSENAELEKIISEHGWSGEILPASRDYLSVINSNVNGYKTDAVVEEKIEHKAEIQSDGSIIDTVSITRKHNGGNSEYEWLNKVNADYMRVYVPEGSKLLDVSGQTREADKSPIDYESLGFVRDVDVQNQEQGISIDENSGTRIYIENGKTVFANWTYVSPGESMTITYRYLLPFALFRISVGNEEQTDSYSLVVQKQSGSVGSEFLSQIAYPAEYQNRWNFPEDAEKSIDGLKIKSDLRSDRFEAVLFQL